MKRTVIILLSLIGISIIGMVIVLADLKAYKDQAIGKDDGTKIVVIPKGAGFNQAVRILEKESLVPSPMKFKLLSRMTGFDSQLKAGEYELSAQMTPLQLLNTLVEGKVRLYRLTIPEGYALKQISEEVEKAGFMPASLFEQSLFKKDLIHALGIEADSFEGYLFPDTYLFEKTAQADLIISTMVKRFWEHFDQKWKERAEELGMSIHEVLTLASIIEKETGIGTERPIISSVFHNRIKKKMRLESDPTVIYGLTEFDGNITKNHLKTSTPYNTYKIKGLPPGPITNPGSEAINAALYPSDTNYLFFVSKKDKTHHFSTNIDEHNQAVSKYQLRKKR